MVLSTSCIFSLRSSYTPDIESILALIDFTSASKLIVLQLFQSSSWRQNVIEILVFFDFISIFLSLIYDKKKVPFNTFSFGIKSICAEMHNFWKCQSQFEILPKQIHEMRSNLSSFDPFLELSQTISQCTRKKEIKKQKQPKWWQKLQIPGHASYSSFERCNLILLFRALLSTTINSQMVFKIEKVLKTFIGCRKFTNINQFFAQRKK